MIIFICYVERNKLHNFNPVLVMGNKNFRNFFKIRDSTSPSSYLATLLIPIWSYRQQVHKQHETINFHCEEEDLNTFNT